MVLAFNLRRQRLAGLQFEASLGKKLVRPSFQSISQVWWHTPVTLATWEAVDWKIMVHASPGKIKNPT
jgi:hypothetical protein